MQKLQPRDHAVVQVAVTHLDAGEIQRQNRPQRSPQKESQLSI
jgi:hypothetical protein